MGPRKGSLRAGSEADRGVSLPLISISPHPAEQGLSLPGCGERIQGKSCSFPCRPWLLTSLGNKRTWRTCLPGPASEILSHCFPGRSVALPFFPPSGGAEGLWSTLPEHTRKVERRLSSQGRKILAFDDLFYPLSYMVCGVQEWKEIKLAFYT